MARPRTITEAIRDPATKVRVGHAHGVHTNCDRLTCDHWVAMRYEGVGFVVVGRTAHLPDLDRQNYDDTGYTLCDRFISGTIDRRGEPVCRTCTKRANRIDGVW